MIEFEYQTEADIPQTDITRGWLEDVVRIEGGNINNLSFVFCDDAFLLSLNQQFLNHDTYTDVICFDDSIGKSIQAEVYISVERVKENARIFEVLEIDELHRVMVHAALHCLGYKDKTKSDKVLMREKEDSALKLRPSELIK